MKLYFQGLSLISGWTVKLKLKLKGCKKIIMGD